MDIPRASITLRACVLIIKNKKVLLVQHTKNGQTYFVLPGGHVEQGEAVGSAAVRELKEECDLDVSLTKLLYVGDFIKKDRHGVDMVFLGKSKGARVSNSNDPDKKYGIITDMRWLDFSELARVDFRPKMLVKEILKDAKIKFSRKNVYVGKYI